MRLAVQPGILLECRGQAELQILERLSAPIAADRIGERLAISGRAVEIDHHHAVAGAGEGLRVPAPVPDVRHAALRAAVHQECHRIFLVALEVRRLHDVAEDVVVVPAGETELLVLAQLALARARLDSDA